jgi:ACS family hexuronate transporter-like MFS transporter
MAGSPVSVPARVGNFRWWICALLFFATAVNYIDRQILGILAGTLEKDIGWSESEYGLIVTAFSAAYAAGQLGFGRVIDRIGARLGYALALGWWSLSAVLHGAVSSVLGFGLVRFALGLGEAGNFPAAVKTVSEWFPRRERALAVGLFNAGSSVGAVVTPLTVPWIAIHMGWRWAFILTGAIGFVWIAAWAAVYRTPRSHPRLSKAELDHILSDDDPPVPPLPWARLLLYRETWALVIARFLTDPVWWFYLYWVPKYLQSKHGLTLDKIGLPLVVIYLVANAGGIFGGWLSSLLIKRGWTVNAARKFAILVCALLVVPLAFASGTRSAWLAVAVLGLATAGHQGWASNMFASISDMFPPHAVSSVTGIAGFGGSIGMMFGATGVGFLLEATGSYVPVFIWAGFSYLFILALICVMIPNIRGVQVK